MPFTIFFSFITLFAGISAFRTEDTASWFGFALLAVLSVFAALISLINEEN